MNGLSNKDKLQARANILSKLKTSKVKLYISCAGHECNNTIFVTLTAVVYILDATQTYRSSIRVHDISDFDS